MNILIQTLYPAPYRVALFELLAEKHNITVFFEKDNDNRNPLYCNYSDKFTYYVLGTENANQAYSKALHHIKQFDVVMLYEYSTKLSGKLILKCIFNHVKYAINCDGAVNISSKFPKRQIKVFFIKHSSLCLAGGKKAREYFETYGAKEKKIVIHNFTSVYNNDIVNTLSEDEKRQLREVKGITGNTVTVSVGRFIASKRFDLLIQIWKDIPDGNCLYIIGSGPLKNELQKQISDNHLKNVFLVDFLERNKLLEFLSISNLFVFTTAFDVWGLVINEAFATGLPVISSEKCTAALEMVVENENGYLIPEDIPHKMQTMFVEKVLDLLSNSEKLKSFSNKAICTAREYTYEKMSSIVLDALEGIK